MGLQRILVPASFVFMVGVGSVVATLPVVLRQLSSNDVEVSLAVTVWGLAYLFSNIPAGVLADKLGANRTVPLAFFFNIAVGLYMYSAASPLGFAVARAIEGLLEALVWTGVFGLAARSENRLLGVSSIYAAIALGFTVGPLVASYLAPLSARLSFLVYSLCSLTSLLITLPLAREQPVGVGRVRIRFPKALVVLPPLIAALTVGLSESVLIVYSPVLASHGAVAGPQQLISAYYLSGLLGQVALRLAPQAIMREEYVFMSTATALLALKLLPEGIVVLGVAVLGFVNAQLASRSQAKVTEAMKGLESTGAGLANLAWALGYFAGSPLYSLFLNSSVSPRTGIALYLLASLAAQLSILLIAKAGSSRARRSHE
ncbi:MFS transporter [Infirmifilum lucidum]|uniref:MFS transporter n=1 Tax=Infirmifilum lucidum TaxID=2776706 RepID=A0A7L9FIE2_9CREN|nr:MFS transporter [Infirmifilum lucidum]QOJ78694.1 MFS transporter [Infirmifilum lucidum]